MCSLSMFNLSLMKRWMIHYISSRGLSRFLMIFNKLCVNKILVITQYTLIMDMLKTCERWLRSWFCCVCSELQKRCLHCSWVISFDFLLLLFTFHYVRVRVMVHIRNNWNLRMLRCNGHITHAYKYTYKWVDVSVTSIVKLVLPVSTT